MSKLTRIVLACVLAVAVLGGLHAWVNLGMGKGMGKRVAGTGTRRGAPGTVVPVSAAALFRVGFLPVTCHLTCPVADWIHQNTEGQGFFKPVRFSGWPELKESLLSGYLPASFLLAPMAMVLAEQGVPIKIVYLGHRDGTALMVHKDSAIHTFRDLRGKRIAVPNRFSNQSLIIHKGLHDFGLTPEDVKIVEMPPPDMPAALYSKSVDAIISGEPFMAETELDGYGRVLYQAKDLWPGFISCVLVVSQKMIDEHPEQVQALVDGIARSGLWLDSGMDHRMSAATAVAKNYYNQDPRLLRFVLSKPPDRVTYTRLSLVRKDFEKIEEIALSTGILAHPIAFEKYTDSRFSDRAMGLPAYTWEGH
jgi:NitT/TauT family transport system substrate-binding protein